MECEYCHAVIEPDKWDKAASKVKSAAGRAALARQREGSEGGRFCDDVCQGLQREQDQRDREKC